MASQEYHRKNSTTIYVTNEIRDKLGSMKGHPKDSYLDVIKALINACEDK